MKELKVGDSFDVVEAKMGDYRLGKVFYNKGDFGVCRKELTWGIFAIIGPQNNNNTGQFMENYEFRIVGNLTITKLKK